VSVCLLVTFVRPAKMTEPIEMLIRLQTQVGPKNQVGLLDGSADPQGEGAMFGVSPFVWVEPKTSNVVGYR